MRSSFIDPGALRHELQLQAPSLSPDGLGGHETVWAEVVTVFGLIEPVAQKANFGAGQTLEENTHRITIRHRQDVASGMRFEKQGRVFHIASIHDPDESGRYLICLVREVGL